jgi:type IV pilus assembly protein PilM
VNRGRLTRWLVDPEPPGLAIDLRGNELAMVRLSDKRKAPEIDMCFTSPLAPGLVRFTMHEPNVVDEEGFQRALESALLRAGVAGRKRIALTLPDYVSRLAVTELPDPPRSNAELAEMLKFRLKKSLPFDTAEARLAFERLPGSPGSTPAFLTGVMREAVVRQYEDILTALGFQVGLVLPSSVSVLQLLRPMARRELAPGADYFFVNVEKEYFSVSLVRDREVPVLTRTLGLRSSGGDARRYDEQDLLQEIIPTAIYYREKLSGGSLERIYYRSLRPDLTHLRELLEDQFEAPTEPFNLMKAIGVAKDVAMDAAVADSMAAAAGAALGRAA